VDDLSLDMVRLEIHRADKRRNVKMKLTWEELDWLAETLSAYVKELEASNG